MIRCLQQRRKSFSGLATFISVGLAVGVATVWVGSLLRLPQFCSLQAFQVQTSSPQICENCARRGEHWHYYGIEPCAPAQSFIKTRSQFDPAATGGSLANQQLHIHSARLAVSQHRRSSAQLGDVDQQIRPHPIAAMIPALAPRPFSDDDLFARRREVAAVYRRGLQPRRAVPT